MKIHVKQHHIDLGSKGSCASDPVALALLEAGYIGPWVSPNHIEFTDKEFGFKHQVPIPNKVVKFLKKYDNNEVVKPFSFEMEE